MGSESRPQLTQDGDLSILRHCRGWRRGRAASPHLAVHYYFVLCTPLRLKRAPDVSEEQWESCQQAQDALVSTVFYNTVTRRRMIIGSINLTPYLDDLHPQIRAFCFLLDCVRDALRQAYEEAEREPSNLEFDDILDIQLPLPYDSNHTTIGLHMIFVSLFRTVSSKLSGDNDIEFSR